MRYLLERRRLRFGECGKRGALTRPPRHDRNNRAVPNNWLSSRSRHLCAKSTFAGLRRVFPGNRHGEERNGDPIWSTVEWSFRVDVAPQVGARRDADAADPGDGLPPNDCWTNMTRRSSVKHRIIWALAAAAVTGLGSVAVADDANEMLADSVASQVKESGKIHGYRLDIEADHGIVTLTGQVSSATQREELVDMVRHQQGVLAVRDRVVVRDGSAQPASNVRLVNESTVEPTQTITTPAGGAASEGVAVAPVIEPEPVYNYQGGIAPYSDSPVMPPYAWPSYTPYNNFASMAYQTQYPSGAWPFIGPPHPYPMIPSGWRSVSLTWKKGYWWMKFRAH